MKIFSTLEFFCQNSTAKQEEKGKFRRETNSENSQPLNQSNQQKEGRLATSALSSEREEGWRQFQFDLHLSSFEPAGHSEIY